VEFAFVELVELAFQLLTVGIILYSICTQNTANLKKCIQVKKFLHSILLFVTIVFSLNPLRN